MDRRPGIAQVGDGRYAVCYSAGGRPAAGNRVMLVTIDARGNWVGGPVTVAEGIVNVGGCDLAWSGERLLVAWWDIALDTPSTMPPHSVIRARFMGVPR